MKRKVGWKKVIQGGSLGKRRKRKLLRAPISSQRKIDYTTRRKKNNLVRRRHIIWTTYIYPRGTKSRERKTKAKGGFLRLKHRGSEVRFKVSEEKDNRIFSREKPGLGPEVTRRKVEYTE